MKISDSDFEKLLQSEEKHSYNKTIAFQGAPEKLAGRPAFRRLAVIAVAALLGAALIAAGAVIAAKTANSSQPPVTSDITETESDATETAAAAPKEKINYTYNNLGSPDREVRTLQNQLHYPETWYDSEYAYAVCIITALKADKSGCTANAWTRIPVEIRIDKILSQNPRFTLKEGDIEVVGEEAIWLKTEEGYSISIRDDIIPITEEGAKYVVLMYSAPWSAEEYYWEGIRYIASPRTIPVSEDGTYDVSLYDDMKLGLDVRECSDDFIKAYFPSAKAK